MYMKTLTSFKVLKRSNWLIHECTPLESARPYPTQAPATLDISISSSTDSSTAKSSLVELISRNIPQKPKFLKRNTIYLIFTWDERKQMKLFLYVSRKHYANEQPLISLFSPFKKVSFQALICLRCICIFLQPSRI